MYHQPEFEPVREEMYDILKKQIHPLDEIEYVNIYEADRRFLAKDIKTAYSLPNLPASDFDGIAVRYEDFKNGMPDTSQWTEENEFVYSNTGVSIPEQYDTVIAIEDVKSLENGGIKLNAIPGKRGEHVAPAGSQLRAGEILGKQGDRIHPSQIGILVSAGYQSVPVYRKPRVVFIPTGDELVPSGGEVPPGLNVESNGAMVSAYVRRFGGEPSVMSIQRDDQQALKNSILSTVEYADLVIIGAGSSKGSKDFTMDVLETIGDVIVQEIGVAPGKHCSLTMVNETPVIGIPGPPGGAQLISQYYVKAAIELLTTGTIHPIPRVPAILDKPLRKMPIDFMQPVQLSMHKDGFHAVPVAGFGNTRAESQYRQYALMYCQRGTAPQQGDFIQVELPIAEVF